MCKANSCSKSICSNGRKMLASDVIHLKKVTGRSQEHLNDVVFLPPQNFEKNPTTNGKNRCYQKELVIFFGGDVQNLSEEMSLHRDHKMYIKWSLEEMALLLGKAYLNHAIMVIRPRRMERATFSCFDNFVDSNFCGAPTHRAIPMQTESPISSACPAVMQVKHLVANVYHQLEISRSGVNTSQRDYALDYGDRAITLIGFSKGVVVLNQILHELQALNNSSPNSLKESTEAQCVFAFTKSIRRMIWLDGGHNGGKDTWITDEKILENLAKNTGIKVEIKVTPYQVQDNRRPWIGKEEKRFRQILGTKFGLTNAGRLKRTLHFENEEANLENHFRVLTTLGDTQCCG